MIGELLMTEKIFETDRKFWSVPVMIVSNVWEDGYHIYEADSAEEALKMYHDDKEFPHEIEYLGHYDQEYKYDELLENEEVEQLNNNCGDVQTILWAEKRRAEWKAEQEGKKQ
tara:strand:- start:63 stop:401 length:339 start_codon:yes stop_codon:yes gene_type:complete